MGYKKKEGKDRKEHYGDWSQQYLEILNKIFFFLYCFKNISAGKFET